MESRQNAVNACFYMKYHQINVNRRDFKRDWMKSRKRCLISNITSIFSILMTIQVLLNLLYCNHVRALYMLVFI